MEWSKYLYFAKKCSQDLKFKCGPHKEKYTRALSQHTQYDLFLLSELLLFLVFLHPFVGGVLPTDEHDDVTVDSLVQLDQDAGQSIF